MRDFSQMAAPIMIRTQCGCADRKRDILYTAEYIPDMELCLNDVMVGFYVFEKKL